MGPELKLLNYAKKIRTCDYENIVNFHKNGQKNLKGWRTSYINPTRDIENDFKRNLILKNKKIDKKNIKYYFLFKELYNKML